MGARRPTIAQRCPRIWTAEDERNMVAAALALRADIEGAGGLDAWIRDRLEQWLPAPGCEAPIHLDIR